MNAYLSHIIVQTGQLQRDVDSLPNVAEQFNAIRLPYNKQLLGCDSFRQYQGDTNDLIASVLQQCIAQASLSPEQYSRLYIVSADLRPLMVDRSQVATLLNKHGLVNALPVMITGQECTGLLSVLDMACQHIASEGGHVLVVSFDVERQDENRIKPFGVLSDAATCIHVSAEPGEYQWLSAMNNMQLQGMLGQDDFDSRQRLATNVTHEVLSRASVQMSDFKWVFSTNFYQPIADFNASVLGIDRAQIYARTRLEQGHCVCSDAILNLDHYAKQQVTTSGELYMLQAYAPGFMSAAVVKAC